MPALHIGVRAPFAHETVRYMVESSELGLEPHFDGDSWEEWGEPREWPTDPQHIVIHGETIGDLVAFVGDLLYAADKQGTEILCPMKHVQQAGILACITPGDDWSEPLLEITDVQAKRERPALHETLEERAAS